MLQCSEATVLHAQKNLNIENDRIYMSLGFVLSDKDIISNCFVREIKWKTYSEDIVHSIRHSSSCASLWAAFPSSALSIILVKTEMVTIDDKQTTPSACPHKPSQLWTCNVYRSLFWGQDRTIMQTINKIQSIQSRRWNLGTIVKNNLN